MPLLHQAFCRVLRLTSRLVEGPASVCGAPRAFTFNHVLAGMMSKALTIRTLMILGGFILSSIWTLAAEGDETTHPVAPFQPAISIGEALGMADRYIQENGVDIAGQYIRLVRLDYSTAPERKGPYWRIHWTWATPRLGGEYGLKIFMDGTIVPERAGP